MKITAIKYSATMQRIYELESLEEIPTLQEEKFVLWIDITEPTIEELSPLESLLGFHPLALKKKPLILKGREDFLLYRILDAIVDNYIAVIEDSEDKMDEIDEEVLEKPTGRTIEKVRMLIRQIRHVHRIIRGQRDVVDKLERSIYTSYLHYGNLRHEFPGRWDG